MRCQINRASSTSRSCLPFAENRQKEKLVSRLLRDKTPGRIVATEGELRTWVEDVWGLKTDGHNVRTLAKDNLAWSEFQKYAQMRKFDPNLCTTWTRSFPERESLKLAGFLLYTAQTMRPRSKADQVAKPMSVYHRYLALRRVFATREQELPPSRGVRDALKGLIRRYIEKYGVWRNFAPAGWSQ